MPTEPDHQALLLQLEAELIRLITDSLAQLERISEIQWRMKEITEDMTRSAPAVPQLAVVASLN